MPHFNELPQVKSCLFDFSNFISSIKAYTFFGNSTLDKLCIKSISIFRRRHKVSSTFLTGSCTYLYLISFICVIFLYICSTSSNEITFAPSLLPYTIFLAHLGFRWKHMVSAASNKGCQSGHR